MVDGLIPEPEGEEGRLSPDRLEEGIGYRFARAELLLQALTHPSFAYESGADGTPDNQRLEYLGDAVLGLVIAKALYERYPELPEGRLSRLKAALVCEETLVQIAVELELGRFMRLGKGEYATGGASKPSILADGLEALLGAIFLDGGYRPVELLVLRLFVDRFDEAYRGRLVSDHKTALQEWVQAQGQSPPVYTVLERTGPSHDMTFFVEVNVGGEAVAQGKGSSKKEAEQAAAAEALELLRERGPGETSA
ncbi:MAG: ribonuclease III [Bradymonadales bacterium]|nr:ribonuclease III [Bradymonadales bacterium]